MKFYNHMLNNSYVVVYEPQLVHCGIRQLSAQDIPEKEENGGKRECL